MADISEGIIKVSTASSAKQKVEDDPLVQELKRLASQIPNVKEKSSGYRFSSPFRTTKSSNESSKELANDLNEVLKNYKSVSSHLVTPVLERQAKLLQLLAETEIVARAAKTNVSRVQRSFAAAERELDEARLPDVLLELTSSMQELLGRMEELKEKKKQRDEQLQGFAANL